LNYTAGIGIDLSGLKEIGPVVRITKTDDAILLGCKDKSQVHISLLASDLIRIRASFRGNLPKHDHSWAIEKKEWDSPRWSLNEGKNSINILTDEIEVIINRDPMMIEFRDPKKKTVINSDERPMMFDPKSTTVAAAKKLGFEEHFYGLGEKASRLDKRRGYFTMWNSDTPAYEEEKDPIYQSIPFYIGWQNGDAYGIFFDNSYSSHFDFGQSNQEYAAFSADGGELNYYFFYGPSIKKILQRYSELTGRMPLPPLWALGNQQSRWSYYPQSVAEEVVKQYRVHDLPLDVLYLDIHHMDEYRVFTWNSKRFPDPKGFTAKLKEQGVKVVTIVDPGVKYEPKNKKNSVFQQGVAKNYFNKYKNGKLFIARVWPGKSVFVDYTIEEARKWWGDLHRTYLDAGVSGIWNDMNEPSDFEDQTGNRMMDVSYYDEGQHSTHSKNRNVFGMLMARATFEGLKKLQPEKRPYVITRAGYAGYQRYATMWTGDNTATWESLALSIPMFQSLGLSGIPFVGADVGGFYGRCNGELLTRWYQVAFLTPMCRSHMSIDSYDHEPWRFGTYYEDIIRKFLKLRYRLLPFLYTNLETSSRTGIPLFRPILLNYQNDFNTLNIDDQFLIGDDLLVAPILKPEQRSRKVYLPLGTWYDYWNGNRRKGPATIYVDAPLEIIPMFVRAGAMIAMQPEMNYVGEKSADSITFEIYLDENGNAETTLYEDDGVSPEYLNGVFRRTKFNAVKVKNKVRVDVGEPEGSYNPAPRKFIYVVKG
jgi:alpha-glucosidase